MAIGVEIRSQSERSSAELLRFDFQGVDTLGYQTTPEFKFSGRLSTRPFPCGKIEDKAFIGNIVKRLGGKNPGLVGSVDIPVQFKTFFDETKLDAYFYAFRSGAGVSQPDFLFFVTSKIAGKQILAGAMILATELSGLREKRWANVAMTENWISENSAYLSIFEVPALDIRAQRQNVFMNLQIQSVAGMERKVREAALRIPLYCLATLLGRNNAPFVSGK